tara:strand:- start:284 stop:475 length:192 start_codon:yes stop_codon:yes gene_type:complete
MSFGYGTKEQLDQQWADLEADKQSALARIRAEKAESIERNMAKAKTDGSGLTVDEAIHYYEVK